MLMLLFYVGGDRYALVARKVEEVIPLVKLKKLARSPDYVAGLLNYRGTIIPAIDLCQLMVGNPYRPYLSTRIIIVNYLGEEQTNYRLGLIAERVTETLDIQETEWVEQGIKLDSAAYLGEVITDKQDLIQCIDIDSLLSESQRRYLLLEPDYSI